MKMVETVYTEQEWCKHMERNAKRLALRWIARQAKNVATMLLMAVVILGVVTVVGLLVETVCRFW